MKISITLIDYKKLDAKQNYRFELARANKPCEAAIIACALARARKGQHASVEIALHKTKRWSAEDLGSVYCAAVAIDEQETIARCEAKYKEHSAKAAKSRRRWAFHTGYLPSGNHQEWMRIWNVMVEDAPLRAALDAENYELAAKRAEELGLKPNEPAKPKGAVAA